MIRIPNKSEIPGRLSDLLRMSGFRRARQNPITTPVVLFVFNRPALTARVFARIAQVKPETLVVIADGPGSRDKAGLCEATRKVVERIDWDCRVLREYSDQNLGCKRRVSSGLDWVFSQFEEAIILEDDCLPALSFFWFCHDLLQHYRFDQRISQISGDNFQFGVRRTSDSYYYSRYPHCWGWASWKRAWQHFDITMASWPEVEANQQISSGFENPAEQQYWFKIFDQCYKGKINSWAYIWTYSCWCQNGLTILPEVNLVSNIGFGGNATHTGDCRSALANLSTGELWKIKHPNKVIRHADADTYTFERVFQPSMQRT